MPSELAHDLVHERDAVFRVDDLTRVYGTEGVEVRALDGVSLSLYAHELVVLLRPTGSGKSTLMFVRDVDPGVVLDSAALDGVIKTESVASYRS